MEISEEDYVAHYGILRRSGRYEWGSGETQSIRNKMFLDHVESLRKAGMSETDIAKGLNISTTELRQVKSLARNQQRQEAIADAQRLRDKGYSIAAISERLGKPPATIRTLLQPGADSVQTVLKATAETLRAAVERDGYIDVGAGVEAYMGVSKERLATAIGILKDEGYSVHNVKTKQVATGHDTDRKVLVKPGVSQKEAWQHRNEIKLPFEYSADRGRTYTTSVEPLTVDPKRLRVVYDEDGGGKADGVIYVRPGAKDLSLGKARYAQGRIKVGDAHYLKGMVVYKDDLPPGVDLEFHTNKKNTGNKLDALKPLGKDPDFPFGAVVRQLVDKPGDPNAKATSAVNIIREEGEWLNWSRNLASQVLSKQTPTLARQQLDLAFRQRKAEFDEIDSLTNPAVKQLLMAKFADGADSAAVNLKAAAMPRQNWHVILPFNSLSENEVYAPNYKNGETVVLVRYPHGGIFEIPELTVNNRGLEPRRVLGSAPDAIGINHKVAARMSGADFDGDTVLVIPNNSKQFKSAPPLAGLKDFDPIKSYTAYEGMDRISPARMQREMGDVSNLITDMTIRGATQTELAAAIRHSMVVIDSEKHNLDYKRSARDNGIVSLKRKYQGGGTKGASTLISRATSETRLPEQKARPAAQGGAIDRETGQKVYVPTGRTYVDKDGRERAHTTKTTKLAATTDARTLISDGNTRMESIYADHSNRLKQLANEARLVQLNAPSVRRSPTAAKAYKDEVASLDAKLVLAKRAKPLERRAQTVAQEAIQAKRSANPDMTKDQLKKVKFQELAQARDRFGAGDSQIRITQREWDAIQAGAISNNKLREILQSADLDQVRALATPRTAKEIAKGRLSRAKAMEKAGYTRGEIAQAIGVSISALSEALGDS